LRPVGLVAHATKRAHIRIRINGRINVLIFWFRSGLTVQIVVETR
jgi:hypothetical protein